MVRNRSSNNILSANIYLAFFVAISSTTADAQNSIQDTTRIVVQGERANEYSGGREILAGKIVLGREWLKNSAASSAAEALRKESSVSVGAGGKISLKGLSGYTQILVDGQPQVGGKDPLQMDPSLIERIEIIHSASADSGAFSIAGTINIVTRNLRKVLPTQITFTGMEDGISSSEETSYQSGWRDSSGTTFNFTAQASNSRVTQVGDARWNWKYLDERRGNTQETTVDKSNDKSVNLSPSLNFKLSPVDTIQLKGALSLYETAYGNATNLINTSGLEVGMIRPISSESIDEHTGGSISFRTQWRHNFEKGGQSTVLIDLIKEQEDQKLDASNFWQSNLNFPTLSSENSTKNFLNGQWQYTAPNRDGHKLQYALSTKTFSKNADKNVEIGGVSTGQDWVGRNHADFRAIDLAAWLQDDWNVSDELDLKVGWRAERRSMRVKTSQIFSNSTATVVAPSVNLAWKLEPEGKSTFTLGVARTFSNLGPEMLNPQVEIRDGSMCGKNGLCGTNDPRTPDRAGNPNLTYEKSWGVDFSIESQFKEASQVSVRGYRRWIRDTFGWVTQLEAAPWASVPRWIMRPRNLGEANAEGVTLALDSHLGDWIEDAPDVSINTSVQWNHSNVSLIKGPDNRIEKQQPWSWRLGLTYKSENQPFELQTDLLINPSQWWQASADRRIYTSNQREASVKAIWTYSPKTRIVISFKDLAPSANRSLTQFDGNPAIRLWASKLPRTSLSVRWESKFE